MRKYNFNCSDLLRIYIIIFIGSFLISCSPNVKVSTDAPILLNNNAYLCIENGVLSTSKTPYIFHISDSKLAEGSDYTVQRLDDFFCILLNDDHKILQIESNTVSFVKYDKENVLYKNKIYLYDTLQYKNKSVEYIFFKLTSDSMAMVTMKEKAEGNHISLRKQLWLDANWLYENRGGMGFKQLAILQKIDGFHCNTNSMKSIVKKANKENISPEKMIFLDSKWLVENDK